MHRSARRARPGPSGTRRPRGDRRDRGATLVEFALLLPILTMFLFGIVQFGIAYDKQQSLNAAAREGARLGSIAESSLDEITGRSVAAANMSAVGGNPKVVVMDQDRNVAGVRCANGTFSGTDTCGAPSSINKDNEALMPCGADIPDDYVIVAVSTPFDISFPFFQFGTVTIDAEAQFRCE